MEQHQHRFYLPHSAKVALVIQAALQAVRVVTDLWVAQEAVAAVAETQSDREKALVAMEEALQQI